MEKEIRTNWATHVEWLILLVTLLGGFYLLDGKIERQGERTDRLYEMFIQQINAIHEETKSFHGRLSVVETIRKGD